jgi:hypothetical protein
MWIMEPDCNFEDIKISAEQELQLISLFDRVYKYRKTVDRAAQKAATIMGKNVYYYNIKDRNKSIRRGREDVKCAIVAPAADALKEPNQDLQSTPERLIAWCHSNIPCTACGGGDGEGALFHR